MDKDKDDPQLRHVLSQRPDKRKRGRRRVTEGGKDHELLHSPASPAERTLATSPNLRELTVPSTRESLSQKLSPLQDPRAPSPDKRIDPNRERPLPLFRHFSELAEAFSDKQEKDASRRLGPKRKLMEYTISQDMTISENARKKVTLRVLEDQRASRCGKRVRHLSGKSARDRFGISHSARDRREAPKSPSSWV